MAVSAVGLSFILLVSPVFQAPKSPSQMDWWKIGARVSSKEERLGLSTAKVLSMGEHAWGRFVRGFQREKVPEILWGTHGADMVFEACLYERNVKILASRPQAERKRVDRLRSELYQFGMTCIGLEDILAGGGTYVFHSPYRCSLNLEKTIYDVVHPHRRTKVAKSIAQIRRRLAPYRDPQKPFKTMLWEKPIPSRSLREWTARSDRHLVNVVRELPQFNRSGQNAIRQFLWNWADYLGTRGSG